MKADLEPHLLVALQKLPHLKRVCLQQHALQKLCSVCSYSRPESETTAHISGVKESFGELYSSNMSSHMFHTLHIHVD